MWARCLNRALGCHGKEYEFLPKHNNVVDSGMGGCHAGGDNDCRSPAGMADGGAFYRPAGSRFQLDAFSGEKVSLKSFRGNTVIMNFWHSDVYSLPAGGSRFGGSIREIPQTRPGDYRGEYQGGRGTACA